jgi:hypothetical protein
MFFMLKSQISLKNIYTPLPQKKIQIVQIPDISKILNLIIRKCQRNARDKKDKGVQPGNWSIISSYEEFEDTKGVIIIHKSKNDRQDNVPTTIYKILHIKLMIGRINSSCSTCDTRRV